MLYQLQGKGLKSKNVEFKRDDLLNMISICSLRLEKMLAILSKVIYILFLRKKTQLGSKVSTPTLNTKIHPIL